MRKEQRHEYFNCQVMFYTKVMHVTLEAEKSYKDLPGQHINSLYHTDPPQKTAGILLAVHCQKWDMIPY